ncbi:MAG: glycosyltransferase family 39 protein [Ardenticatenaceae bacterium]|nr:glycosyltransferase family 39 protein [Anaerolineales bacterium]MCB8920590.1 glycosyltransferase family 39 protein [Ardenticatenaceae bacterium]MCB9002994.1 glycosyltransferase family 39 protein [Ardenticatenaceae bacterium]
MFIVYYSLILMAWVLLLRWPSLDLPIDNDTGARAYHARLILQGEPLYSSHHPGHHLPGIYYTYAAALKLFGDRAWSIKYLTILWTMLVTAVLFRLGKLVGGDGVGWLTAVFYALLSSHVWLWGQTAETELFANLWRSTAVLLLLWLRGRDGERPYFFVGVLGAISLLYKAIYLSPLALTGLVLLADGWQQRDWRSVVRRGLWVTGGVLAVIVPVLLYFAGQGLLARFLYLFTLGQGYVGESGTLVGGFPRWLLYPLLPLYGLAYNNPILLFFSVAGGLLILLTRQNPRGLLRWLTAWFLLSFAEAGVNLELFAHYYLLIVPPLAVLAAWLIWRLVQRVGRTAGRWVLLASLLALVLVASAWQNGGYYVHYGRYRLEQETLADFVTAGWPNFGVRLAQSIIMADYVQAHTNADDLIYYWSEDVQLYYNSQRRVPIDLFWPIDVDYVDGRERIWDTDTALIIIDRTRDPGPPDWLETAVADHYRLETILNEQEIYRREAKD